MKRETIEEFLARGGVVQKIPPSTPSEPPNTLKISSTPENRILSLDDGEFYFAESRKSKKQVKKTSLKDVVGNYNLPQDIVDRLRGGNE
jgi:hypothetical protein